jgi:hypothetical protein
MDLFSTLKSLLEKLSNLMGESDCQSKSKSNLHKNDENFEK